MIGTHFRDLLTTTLLRLSSMLYVLVFEISCAVEDSQHASETSHHTRKREISE